MVGQAEDAPLTDRSQRRISRGDAGLFVDDRKDSLQRFSACVDAGCVWIDLSTQTGLSSSITSGLRTIGAIVPCD